MFSHSPNRISTLLTYHTLCPRQRQARPFPVLSSRFGMVRVTLCIHGPLQNASNSERTHEMLSGLMEVEGVPPGEVSRSCGAGYLGLALALWLCCSACGGISGEFPVLCFSLCSRRIGILKIHGGCLELISMKSLEQFLPHVKHKASECSIAAAQQT